MRPSLPIPASSNTKENITPMRRRITANGSRATIRWKTFPTSRSCPFSNRTISCTGISKNAAFPGLQKPSWGTMGANVWAPDVVQIGDTFVMYYALSVWGGSRSRHRRRHGVPSARALDGSRQAVHFDGDRGQQFHRSRRVPRAGRQRLYDLGQLPRSVRRTAHGRRPRTRRGAGLRAGEQDARGGAGYFAGVQSRDVRSAVYRL